MGSCLIKKLYSCIDYRRGKNFFSYTAYRRGKSHNKNIIWWHDFMKCHLSGHRNRQALAICSWIHNGDRVIIETSWFCLWFWHNRCNGVAMVLASTLIRGIHPLKIFKMVDVQGGMNASQNHTGNIGNSILMVNLGDGSSFSLSRPSVCLYIFCALTIHDQATCSQVDPQS